MSTQPIAGNQSFTNVVNHAGQVPNLDVADLEANNAEFENLQLSALDVETLTVEGDAEFGEESSVDFKGPEVHFEVGTQVLLDGAMQLGKKATGGPQPTIDLTGGGAHCVKWQPGALGTNTFDPPIQAAGGDGTYGTCQLDRTSPAPLIATNGTATNQMPANAISAQIPGTANPVTFEVDSSSQELYVTVAAKTANTTVEVTSFATVNRNQSGTAGIDLALTTTNGTGVTGTIPAVNQSTNFDGTWTMQTSGKLVIAAPTGAKQLLLKSVVSAVPPGVWIQGPDAVTVTSSSHMHVQQTV